MFSHRLELSVRDRILFTICAPVLVPLRIVFALLLALLIWSSSRLGLMFSNPEVSKEMTAGLCILPYSRREGEINKV